MKILTPKVFVPPNLLQLPRRGSKVSVQEWICGSVVKNPPATAGDTSLIPGLERFPRRKKWQPNPIFLPGKSHGQRSLAGHSSWGDKRVGCDLSTKQQQLDTHTHTHTMEYYSAIKKKEALTFAASWMELEGTMLSEISQIKKGKYHMISFICGI